jgi:translation initiation factor 2 beta subunit (eIF-2beta)/eIF-5
MIDTRQTNASAFESSESKISPQFAEQIRRLSHDLSNALEVIMQTSYLLGMAETNGASEDSRKWRNMLDQGVLQATQINGRLRDYIRAHS